MRAPENAWDPGAVVSGAAISRNYKNLTQKKIKISHKVKFVAQRLFCRELFGVFEKKKLRLGKKKK